MASYCGTTDCRLVCNEWTNMAGTDAAAIITEASAMTDAMLGNFDLSPPQPLATGGTVYDYYIRRATAALSVWLAAEGVYRPQYEPDADGWWQRYRTEAEGIFEGLRTGRYSLGSAIAVWERGIAPAVPVANGTIAAPPYGACRSNAEVVGDYYTDDTLPRTFVIELDGSGTSIYGQTFRWQYKGGTAWEQSTVAAPVFGYTYLGYGAAVTFDPSATGTALEAGMRWEVRCTPQRAGNYRGRGLRSWSMTRG